MRNFFLLSLSILFINCQNTAEKEEIKSVPLFENGDLMTDISVDPMGNVLNYPDSDASVTSQIKVWKPGFKSPWHYHPYSGPAYIIQGELTVNFDSETSLDNSSSEKSITKTQTYKTGDAFLGVANTWHFSENLGSEDLIFMISWLGEKSKPLAFFEEK
jgi:oxalate decarboxylase/phosphoglucose isomerase-like protein (cupin superfamily)